MPVLTLAPPSADRSQPRLRLRPCRNAGNAAGDAITNGATDKSWLVADIIKLNSMQPGTDILLDGLKRNKRTKSSVPKGTHERMMIYQLDIVETFSAFSGKRLTKRALEVLRTLATRIYAAGHVVSPSSGMLDKPLPTAAAAPPPPSGTKRRREAEADSDSDSGHSIGVGGSLRGSKKARRGRGSGRKAPRRNLDCLVEAAADEKTLRGMVTAARAAMLALQEWTVEPSHQITVQDVLDAQPELLSILEMCSGAKVVMKDRVGASLAAEQRKFEEMMRTM